jgi:hypothetical protein
MSPWGLDYITILVCISRRFLGDGSPSLLRQLPGARRVVSEGSRRRPQVDASDFPADRPHRSVCHCVSSCVTSSHGGVTTTREYLRILGFSSIQPSCVTHCYQ